MTFLLSIPQAAGMVGVPPSALRREIANSRLPHRKVGARLYVTTDDISEWMEQCRVPAKAHTSIGTSENKPGGYETGRKSSEPAAVKAKMMMLADDYPRTSLELSNPTPADIIPIRSG